MKINILIKPILFISLAFLPSCGDQEKPEEVAELGSGEKLKQGDVPLLPIKEGDYWNYRVSVEVSEGVTSQTGSAIEIVQEKKRIYRGKVDVTEDVGNIDAFDVIVPGKPVERELVEIYEDKILMRGSAFPQSPDSKPIWLDPAVPFVIAGIQAGQDLAEFAIQDGGRVRGLKVVGREKVEVPSGEYDSIRILMTGKDGKFEVRRTTWFAPKVGIVREESARYADGKLLFREVTELVETNVTGQSE